MTTVNLCLILYFFISLVIANLIAGLKGEVLPYCANREVYETTP